MIHFLFDGPPGPEGPRFVECETPDGKSINAGEWHPRPDGLWELRVATAVLVDLPSDHFTSLREANAHRQKLWANGEDVSLLFRSTELGGECGEVLNVCKKIERERCGWRGSRATVQDLANELADVVICADLLAQTEGIDLDAAVAAKFNATSEKVDLPTRMAVK